MESLAIALLPLSVLLVLLVLDRFLKMRQLRSEVQGLPVEQTLMELLLAMQQHRGLSGAYLNGDASFRSKMLDAQRQIDGRISAAQGQYPQLAALAADPWRNLREQWRTLRDAVESLPAAESFARHSALINQLLELKSCYADACGMTLDPHPASYGLLDALVAKVPATLEHVAQARGMGTGIAARGSMTFEERMRMVALSTLIRHSLASLRQALSTAGVHGRRARRLPAGNRRVLALDRAKPGQQQSCPAQPGKLFCPGQPSHRGRPPAVCRPGPGAGPATAAARRRLPLATAFDGFGGIGIASGGAVPAVYRISRLSCPIGAKPFPGGHRDKTTIRRRASRQNPP